MSEATLFIWVFLTFKKNDTGLVINSGSRFQKSIRLSQMQIGSEPEVVLKVFSLFSKWLLNATSGLLPDLQFTQLSLGIWHSSITIHLERYSLD